MRAGQLRREQISDYGAERSVRGRAGPEGRTMPRWLAMGGEGTMAGNTSLSRSAHSKILAHLRTLRASLAQARDALMHFKDDRLDRDKLEPAARRVDDLINMFAGNFREPEQRSEEHTSENQSQSKIVCRLLLVKKKNSLQYSN